MKKNKLYTVNKYNMPAFMPKNLFVLGGDQSVFFQHQGGGTYGNTDNISMDLKSIPSTTYFYQSSQPNFQNQQWANNQMNNVVQSINTGQNKNSSTVNQGNSWGTAAKAVGGAAAEVGASPMTIDGRTYKRGLFDATDPFYHAGDVTFSDGNKGHIENSAGNLFSDAGVKVFQGGASAGNGYVMFAGSALKSVGDIINNGWGLAYNDKAINTITKNTENSRNVGNALGSASNTNDLMTLSNYLNSSSGYGSRDLVKGGVFRKKKARRKGQGYINKENAALAFQNAAFMNAVKNVDKRQDENIMRNFAAYGGPLDTIGNNNMGAIEYGFMSDYLTNRRKLTENKNQMTNMFMGSPSTMFSFGGDMQTNYSDFSTGLTHINEGGMHEENPNDGVQMGIDNEGTPNLVEEGETVYNDYVFSNRITCDETTKKLFHLPKKKDVTYAEVSKKLEREISERPNDPISRAGFNAQMQKLEEQQERQKQEMEAERAKAAFEALSPEEQTAVMQQVAQQQTPPLSPEEVAMTEQQAVQAEPSSEEMLAQQQAQVAALGGRLVKASDVTEEDVNMFAVGGRKARKAAKRYNKDWFLAQAKSLGMIDDDATDIDGWEFNPNDPDANLSTFNNKYRDFQKKKALETYRTGQRKSKENELFGSNGLYRYSDDNSKIFKARTNDKDRIGWINADYTGAIDDNGNLKGFLSQEDYNKLSDKDKEAYKRINERAGDRMYDFRGKAIEDIYNGNIDEILGAYNYDDGFKWDDKEAQTLQYPVGMERSNLSYLRYAPALGGAIGLAYDMLNPADYSNAEAIINASKQLSTPTEIQPHYIGDYLTYRPMDIWFEQNRMDANARATDRAIMNSSSPSKMAGLLASGYNNQIANGELYRKALEYNDALREKAATFNRGTNQFNAQMDYQTQAANQQAKLNAGRYGMQGLLAGYQMKDDIDARRRASMSANLTNLLQSIGNIGEEAYDEDRLKWLERTGTLRSNMYDRGKYSAKEGGKLRKKKKGLTY